VTPRPKARNLEKPLYNQHILTRPKAREITIPLPQLRMKRPERWMLLNLQSPSKEIATLDRARGTSLPSAEIPHKRSVVAEVAAEEAVVAEGNRAPP
jgi:hypothetical protein